MINQLKQFREFVEVIQSLNPSICQLPPRVLLDAADTHNLVSDLIKQIESTEPVTWMVTWEQSKRKPVFANCIEKAQWIAQPEGLADRPTSTIHPLYTHPAPLRELSDNYIEKLWEQRELAIDRPKTFARAIEAHLKGNT